MVWCDTGSSLDNVHLSEILGNGLLSVCFKSKLVVKEYQTHSFFPFVWTIHLRGEPSIY